MGIDQFLENGRLGAECIKHILAKNGMDLERRRAVLDFGCGCESILRHLKTVKVPKRHGVDSNPALIRWRKASLPLPKFHINTLSSGLRFFSADAFDLIIYATSAFTDPPEPLQNFWMNEVVRVLRSDGTPGFTVQDGDRLHQTTLRAR
jgi:hypothetical protein